MRLYILLHFPKIKLLIYDLEVLRRKQKREIFGRVLSDTC